MGNNIWENDDGAFRDGMPDDNGGPTHLDDAGGYVPQPKAAAPGKRGPKKQTRPVEEIVEEVQEELVETAQDDDEEDYTSVLSDARLRLEQGRLYEMIMNHDLFKDTDADPAAIKHVQKQIKRFAKEQMEIMLGMRQEAPKFDPSTLSLVLPFNSLEISILKKLASAATKGVSEQEDQEEYAAPVQSTPAVQAPVKKQGLTPVSFQKKQTNVAPTLTKPVSKPVVKAAVATKPLPAKAPVPLKRLAKSETIDQILAEEGVPRHLIEEDYVPMEKPLEQMKPKDREKRMQESQQRLSKSGISAKAKSALPQPSFDQELLLHSTTQQEVGEKVSMTSLLLKAVNNKNANQNK